MVKLPVISAKNLIKILSKYGAKKIRQRGSHLFIEFNGRKTTIPMHSNKDLGKGLLKTIFDDLELEDTDVYEKLILD